MLKCTVFCQVNLVIPPVDVEHLAFAVPVGSSWLHVTVRLSRQDPLLAAVFSYSVLQCHPAISLPTLLSLAPRNQMKNVPHDENIRIYHKFVDKIDKSVPVDSLASRGFAE